MGQLNKSRKQFIEQILLLFMSMRCRYTFLNMARYGRYCERSYRYHFARIFDFLDFNHKLFQASGATDCVLAFDPTYVRKSGKKTAHVDTFYNGVASKRLPGLELGVLALIDRKRKTAFPLEAIQSRGPKALKAEEKSLVDHYAQIIIDRKDKLIKMAKYLVVDGFFAKKKYLGPIREKTQLHVITMLRRDAFLQYLYQPKQGVQRGRPRKYDGKVKLEQLDPDKVEKVCDNQEVELYAFKAYAESLKQTLLVVLARWKHRKGKAKPYAVYCSTDLELDPISVFEMFKERFQIEFLIRDAKQFTGLEHCQARSEEKIHMHVNLAFTAIGIAKAISYPRGKIDRFSMANWKNHFHNRMMMNFFFHYLDINPNEEKIIPIINRLTSIGNIAA